MVHGDDFVFCGGPEALKWVAKELGKAVLLKVVGILGGDAKAGEVHEARCLNRVIRWTPQGLTLEADPRHAELLGAMLGPRATPLSAPGAREPGQSRDRIHDLPDDAADTTAVAAAPAAPVGAAGGSWTTPSEAVSRVTGGRGA